MQCSKCNTSLAGLDVFNVLEGDEFIISNCSTCSGAVKYMRLSLSWSDVAYIVLYHLTLTTVPESTDDSGRKYYLKRTIAQVLEENWNYLWDKPSDSTWKRNFQSHLYSEKFFSTEKRCNSWALKEVVLPRVALGMDGRKVVGQIIVNENGSKSLQRINVDNSIEMATQKTEILVEQEEIKQEVNNVHKNDENNYLNIKNQVEASSSLPVERKRKNEIDDLEKKWVKESVRRTRRDYVDPKNCISVYPDLDNIKSTVVICDFPTHSAPQMKITNGGKTVTTDKGYRLAKSSHGIWEGSWYFEVTIDDNPGHVRIGWSQISGDLQAPCGYDSFSYSFRDSPGTLFHQSKAIQDCPTAYSQGYGVGDILGVFIHLPSLTESNRQELSRRHWNPLVDKEYVQIRARPLNPLKNAEIRYFKNGIDLGQAFSSIYFGKYHAAVSCYMGGKVTFNFGPKFKFPQRKGKPLSQASSLVFSPAIEVMIEQVPFTEDPEVKAEQKEHITPLSMQDSSLNYESTEKEDRTILQ